MLMLSALAVLMLLCLPQLAMAETKTVALSNYVAISPGETRKPVYRDYSAIIGAGLTMDDFDVTYKAKSKELTVTGDGTITVPEDIETGVYYVEATYTPKVSGVGTKATYNLSVLVTKPLRKVTSNMDGLYIPLGETAYLMLELSGATSSYVISTASYDDEIISVERSTSQGSGSCRLNVKGLAAGETYLTVTSYNGITKSFPVAVVEAPTKFEFGSDHFYCYVGDTVDLGIDLGNGPYGEWAYPQSRYSATLNGNYYGGGSRQYGYGSFTPGNAGEYEITIKVEDFTASTRISAYDKANCVVIELADGELLVDEEGTGIRLYDAAGNTIYRPMKITEGSDIAAIRYDKLIATAAGSVTITVENDDGTTISRTFEVKEKPTSLTIDPATITLQIGDVYTLEPVFDTGSFNCTYTVDYTAINPPYDLYCIRLEGSKIIAQAPGSATVTAQYGSLSATCKVTVPDSDKAIHIEMPGEGFGTYDTFQARVVDKTGTEYPATFSCFWGNVEVTSEGLITGVKTGTFHIVAQLEDGRKLASDTVEIISKPKWMTHEDILTSSDKTSVSLGTTESDVGRLYAADLVVTVADETVATYSDGKFLIHKAGATKVTLKSRNNDTTTTFLLEVVDAEASYAGSTTLELPYGFQTELPTEVYNASGKKVTLTWTITYDDPGEGNTAASGFVLEGNVIACVWPDASCVLTGTAKDGTTVKIFVSGYMLPYEIALDHTEIELNIGEGLLINVLYDEENYKVNNVYWFSESAGIVNFSSGGNSAEEMVTNYPNVAVSGKAVGTTLIAAMLDNGAYAIAQVTVKDPYARMPGDANEDGQVDLADALLAMQYDAGWPVSINGYAADVNADNVVDSQDVLLLIQYGAGLDVVLRQYVPAP